MIGPLPILALDGPELAIVGFRDEIDALVGGGEVEPPCYGLRHFAVKPDVLELAGILWLKLKECFDEMLEQVALLLLSERLAFPLNVFP